MLEDPLQILLVDRVEDAGAAALLDEPQRGLGGVLDGRREPAPLRDVAEAFPVERVVPSAARNLHVLRIAAAALVHDQPRGLLLQLRPHRRLQPLQHFLASAFERVRGNQRGLDARRRRGIRVLIDRCVDAARAGFVDQPQRIDALAPVVLADDLVVRDLRRQPALLANLDRLLHALRNRGRFVAHVRDVDAAHAAGDFRELDDFGRRRERPGHVEQARAQSERAVLHALAHEDAHLLDLVRRRLAVDRSDDLIAHGALADEQREIRRDARRREAIHEPLDRQRRRSVRSFDERRHALPHVIVGGRHVEDPAARLPCRRSSRRTTSAAAVAPAVARAPSPQESQRPTP